MRSRLFDMADGYPGQYTPGDSPVHACPPGVKLLAALALSTCALFARDGLSVGVLGAVHVGAYHIAGFRLRDVWRDVRPLLLQLPVVLGLYLLRFAPEVAASRAVVVSLQLAFALLPTLLLQRTTRPEQLMRGLRGVLPERLSFVLFTSLRFVPLVMRETKSIYLHQVLRGARITPRHLANPLNWRDLVRCVIVPLIIRMMAVARDIAVSATSRGMGGGV